MRNFDPRLFLICFLSGAQTGLVLSLLEYFWK